MYALRNKSRLDAAILTPDGGIICCLTRADAERVVWELNRQFEKCDIMSVVQKESTYRLLSLAAEEFPQLAGVLSESGHANATVCPYCRVDDFVHVEGCRLEHSHEDDARKLRHFEAMERALREIVRNYEAAKDYPGMEHAAKIAWKGANMIAEPALAAYDADKE